jgi:hypothetical protein
MEIYCKRCKRVVDSVWHTIKHELHLIKSDQIEDEETLDCIMCNNKNAGWYEVMAVNCGNPDEKILEILCDVHLDIFKEQLRDIIKRGEK